MFTNSPLTTIDTATIRGSRPVVPPEKRVPRNFANFTRKHLLKRLDFNKVANLQFNFIKKEIQAQMFFCEFWEISNKIFLKKPFGRLLLHKQSFCLLSQHDLVPFQKRSDIYFPAECFLGLICRLGTRVSSIFQTLS